MWLSESMATDGVDQPRMDKEQLTTDNCLSYNAASTSNLSSANISGDDERDR
jgi:hypothetical protein